MADNQAADAAAAAAADDDDAADREPLDDADQDVEDDSLTPADMLLMLRDPSADCTDALTAITVWVQAVLEHPTATSDSGASDTLVELLLIPACSTILKRHLRPEERPEHVLELIVHCVHLAACGLRTRSPHCLNLLAVCFDYQLYFWQRYGYPPHHDAGASPAAEATPEWRASIGFSKWVDAIRTDPVDGSRTWMRAQIVEETGTHLLLDFEHTSDFYTQWVTRDSADIAPKDSKTKKEAVDMDWFMSLQQGSLLDVLDPYGKWYNSTILQVMDSAVGREVLVGYRVYVKHGEKSDQMGNYTGWPGKFDEWLSFERSPQRFARFNTRAGANAVVLEPPLDDSADRDAPTCFAEFRDEAHGSPLFATMLNEFGMAGGFNAALLALNADPLPGRPDHPNATAVAAAFRPQPISVSFVQALVQVFAGVTYLLNRSLAASFLPPFRDAVFAATLGLADEKLKDITREHIGAIVDDLLRMLERLFNRVDAGEFVEVFNLNISLKCFTAPYFNTQLLGFKMLLDCIKASLRKPSPAPHYLAPQTVVEWLQTNKVLPLVYGRHSNPEIVQRSSELLRFLLGSGALTEQDLDVVWSVMGTKHPDTIITLNKVLTDLICTMPDGLISHLLAKVMQLPGDDVLESTIALLLEAGRVSDFGITVLDFLWAIVQDESKKYDASTVQAADSGLILLLRDPILAACRLQFAQRCVENLQSGRAVLCSMAMLRNIVESLPLSTLAPDHQGQGDFIRMLDQDFQLLNVFFEQFHSFNEAVSARSTGGTVDAAAAVGQLQASLQFLLYLVTRSTLTIDFAQVSKLWTCCVAEPPVPDVTPILLDWLSEACGWHSTGRTVFSPHAVHDIYTGLMIPDPSFAFTDAGFLCFKAFFCLVNELNGGLRNTGRKDADIEVHILPRELVGASALWKIALEASLPTVTTDATALINLLHSQLAPALADRMGLVRNEYIHACITELRASMTAQSEPRILRVLGMLDMLLNASETKGTYGVRSHGARLRGLPLSIHFVNKIRGTRLPETFVLLFFSNAVLWDVRRQIGAQAGVNPERIRVFYDNGVELLERDNSRTLAELKIKNNTALQLVRRAPPPTAKAALLTRDMQLTPRAAAIFTEWFASFSKNGRMDRACCAAFINSCSHRNACAPEDTSVTNVMDQFPKADGEYLTEADFLRFYRQSCLTKEAVVWANLDAHGYRRDLRKDSDVPDEHDESDQEAHRAILPRALLANEEQHFALLFELVTMGGEVTETVWKLLMRLPTNPSMLRDLKSLEAVKTPDPRWDVLLDSHSPFRLLYSLQILESFVETGDEGQTVEDAPSEDELHDRAEWRKRFLLFGGFPHLYGILLRGLRAPDASASEAVNRLVKSALALVLKIVRFFLLGALSIDRPNLFQVATSPFHRTATSSSTALAAAARAVAAASTVESPAAFPGSGSASGAAQPAASPVNASPEPDAPTHVPAPSRLGLALEPDIAATRTPPRRTPSQMHHSGSVDSTPVRSAALSDTAVMRQSPDFRRLVRQLSGSKLSGLLLDHVDFFQLQQCLLSQVAEAVEHCSSEEDCKIVQYGLGLWLGCIVDHTELWTSFVARFDPTKFVLSGLFCAEYKIVRKEFAHVVRQLCEYVDAHAPTPLDLFLNGLLDNIPTPDSQLREHCDQFFQLVRELLVFKRRSVLSSPTSAESHPFAGLLKTVVVRLVTYPTQEKRDVGVADRLLVGLFSLLTALLEMHSGFSYMANQQASSTLAGTILPAAQPSCTLSLVTEVFYSDLFSFGEPAVSGLRPRCKHDESRRAAFNLLLELCRDSAESLALMFKDCFIPSSSKPSKVDQWQYRPSAAARAPCGLVGMKNIGNVCYLNAIVQQLYMVPGLRNGILAVEDATADRTDSVLYQLQLMFGALRYSERQAYSPRAFCQSFKQGGQSIDISKQQDAQAFLLSLIDQLETSLKPTSMPRLFQDAMGGMICCLLECQGGCGTVRESEEAFFCLSVEVKNMKNMDMSLEHYVKRDTISDYFCDKCNATAGQLKRVCLKKLPKHLFVQCNRFVFDFESMVNVKLNTRFEFPMALNLEPYTKEGLAWREADPQVPGAPTGPYTVHPESYYEYELAGVVVHAGTADFGHYYSFVRKRADHDVDVSTVEDKDATSEPGPREDAWFLCDDATVTPWSSSKMDAECFGGPISDEYTTIGMSSLAKDNIRNAYVLVYDRKLVAPAASPTVASSVTSPPLAPEAVPVDAALHSPVHVSPGLVAAAANATAAGSSPTPVGAEFFAAKKDMAADKAARPRALPTSVLQFIKEDNNQFQLDCQTFHSDFLAFVARIVQQQRYSPAPPATIQEVCGWAANFFFQVFSHAAEVSELPTFCTHLSAMLCSNPDAGLAFLQSLTDDPSTLAGPLLQCPQQEVRICTSKMLIDVLSMTFLHEHAVLFEQEEHTILSPETGRKFLVRRHVAVTMRFLDTLLGLIPDAVKSWPKFQQYWEIFAALATKSNVEQLPLIIRRLSCRLLDLYLGDESPRAVAGLKRPQMGNQVTEPVFAPMLVAAVALLLRCDTRAGANGWAQVHSMTYAEALADLQWVVPPEEPVVPAPQPAAHASKRGNSLPHHPGTLSRGGSLDTDLTDVDVMLEDDRSSQHASQGAGGDEDEEVDEEDDTNDDRQIFTISTDECSMVMSGALYAKALSSMQVNQVLPPIRILARRWARGDHEFSTTLALELVHAIDTGTDAVLGPYFDMMMDLLSIDDEYQDHRLVAILGGTGGGGGGGGGGAGAGAGGGADDASLDMSGLLPILYEQRYRSPTWVYECLWRLLEIARRISAVSHYIADLEPMHAAEAHYTDWIARFTQRCLQDPMQLPPQCAQFLAQMFGEFEEHEYGARTDLNAVPTLPTLRTLTTSTLGAVTLSVQEAQLRGDTAGPLLSYVIQNAGRTAVQVDMMMRVEAGSNPNHVKPPPLIRLTVEGQATIIAFSAHKDDPALPFGMCRVEWQCSPLQPNRLPVTRDEVADTGGDDDHGDDDDGGTEGAVDNDDDADDDDDDDEADDEVAVHAAGDDAAGARAANESGGDTTYRDTHDVDTAGGNNPNEATGGTGADASAEGIACPHCTFINPPMSQYCNMCDNPMD